jgi:hypothetical protein
MAQHVDFDGVAKKSRWCQVLLAVMLRYVIAGTLRGVSRATSIDHAAQKEKPRRGAGNAEDAKREITTSAKAGSALAAGQISG